MEIIWLLGQAEVGSHMVALVRGQSEFPSWTWKQRAGDKLFVIPSSALLVNAVPDAVGTFQLCSIRPHLHAAAIGRLQALPHTHIQTQLLRSQYLVYGNQPGLDAHLVYVSLFSFY